LTSPTTPATDYSFAASNTEDSYVLLESAKKSPHPDQPRKVELARARSRTEGANMDSDLPNLRIPAGGSRVRQVQDAKKIAQIVAERSKKKGIDPPDYEFYELIGKGTYGRVYRCRDRKTQRICAVKIIEVDQTDYKADAISRDDTIKEFIRETSILQSLKDNKVKNVNMIYDAFSVDSWLWIVTEYCPGGSLATLMKANNRPSYPGLEEEFIIPVAREVAVALKSVHEAGIIHRDLKCANILVTEDGRLQLCDFGISNVLENEVSKRSTIIGTPHWMAPELVAHLGSEFQSVRYGTEIDCWAFGCAVYEMATGLPPHSRVRPQDLGLALHRSAPRLEGSKYAERLRDFVAFLLEESPDKRPSAAQIMEHKYIKDTDTAYPTVSVRKLIQNFAKWESEGGQRTSLFNPFGAGGAGESSGIDSISPTSEANNEWNFSTTLEFERRFSMGLDPFDRSKEKTPLEIAKEEARVMRGGHAMRGIFDTSENPYGSGNSQSDLHFRNLSNPPHSAADRTTLIDLDAVIPSFDEGPNLDLDSVPTIKARKFLQNYGDDSNDPPPYTDSSTKRDTIHWTFPSMFPEEDVENSNRKTQDWKFPTMTTDSNLSTEEASQTSRRIPRDNQSTNRETRDWTFPTEWPSVPSAQEYEVASRPKNELKHSKTAPTSFVYSSVASSPDRSSMIDLDSALHVQIPEISRPTTADSTADSAVTDMTSGDPFDLEPQIHLSQSSNRGSLHMKSQSEPSAGFQNNPSSGDDKTPSLAPDTNLSHIRSSSVTDGSDMNRNSGRVSATGYSRWAGRTAYDNDASVAWDPFSDNEDDYYQDRRLWPSSSSTAVASAASSQYSRVATSSSSQSALRRNHRRAKTSTGSAQTVTSDEGVGGAGLGGGMGATLRPAHAYRQGGGSRMGLRPPRDANKAVLLGANRRLMEEELGMMYEELGVQADMMIELLAGLVIEEEGGVGELKDTPIAIIGE
jgi:protein-serine/threonine kinase